MFALMKSKNPYERQAHDVYSILLGQTRDKAFYKALGVEDSFEGRYELLCLHAFIVMHVTLAARVDQHFNQALFDLMFADIDQSLRQMGKGDMGVPKHMRRMMKGFNGRMNAYEEAFEDKADFEEALRRNVYGGDEKAPVKKMVDYVRKNVVAQKAEDLLEGKVKFSKVGK